MSVQNPPDSLFVRPKSTANSGTLKAMLNWIRREPLLHFAVLGGLIFATDRLLHPPELDTRTIIVTKSLQDAFIKGFDEDGERAPTPEELKNMIDSWVASEILYREGKQLGVDKGDDMIRDRIAFKLQVLVFDQVKLDPPTEEQLRAYFDKTRARYDQPEKVSFLLTPATDKATAQRNFNDIANQREASALRDQTRIFTDRPVASLGPSFGDNFRDRLLKLTIGEWTVLEGNDGWHIARLDEHQPAVATTFEAVREALQRNWTTEETRKRAWDAVQKLKANYTVRIEK